MGSSALALRFLKTRGGVACWFYLVKLAYLAGPKTRYSFDQLYRGIESLIMMLFDIQNLNTRWDSPLLIPPRESRMLSYCHVGC